MTRKLLRQRSQNKVTEIVTKAVGSRMKVGNLSTVSKLQVPVSAVKASEEAASVGHIGQGARNWHALCLQEELSCELTLTSGQVFHWQRHQVAEDETHWYGVIGSSVFVLRDAKLRNICAVGSISSANAKNWVEYQCLHPLEIPNEIASESLRHYFRLEVPLAALYETWIGAKEDKMAATISQLPGLRIIRQDPLECLFSFLCSSNNNIARITQMLQKLRFQYGKFLCSVPASDASKDFYAFPTLDDLCRDCTEKDLRELGFGYRAAFIVRTAQQLQALGGRRFLEYIRDASVSETEDSFCTAYQEQLMEFHGVGRKVADCIALFSLEKLHAIPVDTHVWKIACREFDASLQRRKSLTPTIYKQVGDHFRNRFSPHAGWAHSVLFTGELQKIKENRSKAEQKISKRRFTEA